GPRAAARAHAGRAGARARAGARGARDEGDLGGAGQAGLRHVGEPPQPRLVHARRRARDRGLLSGPVPPVGARDRLLDRRPARGRGLLAHDRHTASALAVRPAFGCTGSGYAGASAGRLSPGYDALRPGNVVQTAATSLTGRAGHRELTLALGFGLRGSLALQA